MTIEASWTGKLVSKRPARALKEKRMADYIREEGIEAIIDWPLWFEALLVQRSPAGAAKTLGPAQPAGRVGPQDRATRRCDRQARQAPLPLSYTRTSTTRAPGARSSGG